MWATSWCVWRSENCDDHDNKGRYYFRRRPRTQIRREWRNCEDREEEEGLHETFGGGSLWLQLLPMQDLHEMWLWPKWLHRYEKQMAVACLVLSLERNPRVWKRVLPLACRRDPLLAFLHYTRRWGTCSITMWWLPILDWLCKAQSLWTSPCLPTLGSSCILARLLLGSGSTRIFRIWILALWRKLTRLTLK